MTLPVAEAFKEHSGGCPLTWWWTQNTCIYFAVWAPSFWCVKRESMSIIVSLPCRLQIGWERDSIQHVVLHNYTAAAWRPSSSSRDVRSNDVINLLPPYWLEAREAANAISGPISGKKSRAMYLKLHIFHNEEYQLPYFDCTIANHA